MAKKKLAFICTDSDGTESLAIPNRGFAAILLLEYIAQYQNNPMAIQVINNVLDAHFRIRFGGNNTKLMLHNLKIYINSNL